MTLAPLQPNVPIVNPDGTLTDSANLFFSVLAKLTIIPGDTAPEGVVVADVTRLYLDTSRGFVYIKNLDNIGGDRSKGWVRV